MKTKIKLLTRLIILTLFSTFMGCNEELYEIKDHHNGLDKNKISLDQFKNETNISNLQPVLSVSTTKSIAAKTKTQLSDFVIDTLAVKKLISENNNTTYTFRIYPLFEIIQPNDIYNLVYHKVNDNWETAIFYLKKLPEENGEHNLFEKIERIYGGKVINGTSSKVSNLEMCATQIEVVMCTNNKVCLKRGSCDGYDDTCPTGECTQSYIIYEPCSSGSGGGSFSSGSIFGGGTVSGGGTGSSGTYSYSPHYINNPAFEDPKYINELNKTYTWNNLSKELKDFFNTRANNKYFDQTIQYQIDNKWSSESKKTADLVRNYLMKNPLKSDFKTTELFFKALKSTNNFQNDLTELFIKDNISYFSQDVQKQLLTDPLLALQIAQEYLIQRAVKKYLHPDWNEVEIYYSVLWDLRHMTLDALGLFPVVGEVADLVNGTLYTLEGDKVNAAFSFASAVPVAGWAAVGVKFAVKLKTASTIGTKVLLTWKVLPNNIVYFGANSTCRAQLRRVLGLAVGNLNQAHHIIPLNLQTNPVVQKAAKSGNSFHINEALNGIPLSTAVHNGSHGNYDAKIFKKLDVFDKANPNATPNECYQKVEKIIQEIRTAIQNNPTTPINQLNF